jgi:Domain of unknown function (DUF3854)
MSTTSIGTADHRKGMNGLLDPVLLQTRDVAIPDQTIPPNLVGSGLATADFAALAGRWVDRVLAEAAFLRWVDSFTGSQLVGRKGGDYAGIAIPYFAPGTRHVREYRLRRDHPDLEAGANGELKVKQKYLSPPGRGNMLYLPPGTDPRALQKVDLPIVITEGEFKTLVLSRLAKWNSPENSRFLPIGIAGVFNWRGTIGKTTGPDGQKFNVRGPIPDLDWIRWEGRKVIIAFDADASTKEQVRLARWELAQHLRYRGSAVGFYEWDLAQGKGIDDHLASIGPEAVLQEISRTSFTGFNWRED